MFSVNKTLVDATCKQYTTSSMSQEETSASDGQNFDVKD